MVSKHGQQAHLILWTQRSGFNDYIQDGLPEFQLAEEQPTEFMTYPPADAYDKETAPMVLESMTLDEASIPRRLIEIDPQIDRKVDPH